MNVDTPVFVKPFVLDDKQMLKIYYNGKVEVVESPIKPYIYSDEGEGRARLMTRMSTGKPAKMFKTEFNTLDEMSTAIEHGVTGVQPTKNFIDLIIKDRPEFFKDFAHSSDLKMLTFDIEQYVKPGDPFPFQKDDNGNVTVCSPVISISYQLGDGEIKNVNMSNCSEEYVIKKFAQDLADYDPDIICGFNHCHYDMQVLDHKFEEYGVPAAIWSRNNERPPFYYTKQMGPVEVTACSVEGRVVLDVFHYTMTDQTLSGLKRGLKPVATHYKDDLDIEIIVEEDLAKHGTAYLLEQPEKLVAYNNSDVNLTKKLADMYIKNSLAIAKYSGAPLNRVIPLASTYAGNLEAARELDNAGILADSNNKERYPWVFDSLGTYIDENGEEKNQKPYQGGLSRCYRPGVYKNIVEQDFASLYPSVMASLGCGSDNTRVIGTTELGPFKVEVKDDIKTYYAPDEMRGWNWIIEVRGQSAIATRLEALLKRRLEIKKEAEETGSEALYSMAYAIKVVLNSFYGIMGSEVLPYGDIGVAALITIVGRMCLTEAMNFTGREHILLVDTDSIKMEQKYAKPLEEINAHFDKFATQTLVGKPIIKLDDEHIEAGFLKQPKTYLLIKNGKFKKIGSAFKNTRFTNIFNNIIDNVGYKMLTDGEDAAKELARKYYDLDQYEIDDFTMSVRLGKPITSYANQNSLAPKLAKLAQQKEGKEIFVGQVIDYIKTEDGYDLASEEALSKIDRKYYLGVVQGAVDRLLLEDVLTPEEWAAYCLPKKQSTLSDWV